MHSKSVEGLRKAHPQTKDVRETLKSAFKMTYLYLVAIGSSLS
jgi:hypothetical protein